MKIGQQQEEFLVTALFSLGLGIFAGSVFSVSLSALCVALFALLVLSGGLLSVQSRWAWLSFLLVFFCLGMIRFSCAEMLPTSDISKWKGNVVRVTGIAAEAPRKTETADGTQKLRYLLNAKQVEVQGKKYSASGNMYVYASIKQGETVPDARIGDEVTASGKVRIPHGYADPGQLDTVQMLRSQGITAQLVAGKQGIRVIPQESMLFLRKMEEIRTHYRTRMEEVMPKSDAAAIFAMLFGGYEGIRPELTEAFTVTGIVHILSVSGSHISLLAATIAWLGGLCRLSRRIQVVFVVAAIVVYSILSGCVPPVLRSALMGGLTFLALALEREKEAGRILLLTGMGMLLASPMYLFHISFQLSFLATAGLLYAAPPIRRWMRERNVPEFFAGALSITIAAQLSTLPILAWYFNQLSLSSLLANLLIVPIVEGMIVLGLFSGMVAFFLPFLGKVFFLFNSLLLGVVYEMARWMEALPASQVYLPTFPFWLSVLFYAGLLMVCSKRGRDLAGKFLREQKVLAISMVLLVGAISFAWHCLYRDEVVFAVLDVGQGDAMLLKTAHHAAMFDAGGTREGGFDVGARVDVPYLLHQGVRKLDYIFLTHAHEDHAGGVGGILRKHFPVGTVLTASESRAAYEKVLQVPVEALEKARLRQAVEGEVFELDGVKVEVLYAPACSGKPATGNEVSNVYRITYGKASFLVTGDLVAEEERKLLEEGKDVQALVLKCGHHGSRTSTSQEFLEAVHPRYAVIGVGRDNSFGHPNKEILERLEKQGIEIYRTDMDGAIEFHTDGKRMWAETYIERNGKALQH